MGTILQHCEKKIDKIRREKEDNFQKASFLLLKKYGSGFATHCRPPPMPLSSLNVSSSSCVMIDFFFGCKEKRSSSGEKKEYRRFIKVLVMSYS